VLLHRLAWPVGLFLVAGCLIVFKSDLEDGLGFSVHMIGGVLAYIATAWLGSRIFGLVADHRKRHKRPYPRLFKDLVAVLLFFIAIVASAALLMEQGIVGALAGSSLILAVLGFAVRNVVADTLSGVALGIEGPYRIGDWVDVDQVARGRVIEIGWRTTRILTLDSTYMILPNSQIARRRITNFSAPKPQYRAQLSLKLSRELSVETARRLILHALAEARLIQAEPAPDVKVLDLGSDDTITYAVRFWLTRFESDADSRDEIFCLIDRALRQAKVGPSRTHIELTRKPVDDHDPITHAEEVARIFSDPTEHAGPSMKEIRTPPMHRSSSGSLDLRHQAGQGSG